MSNEEIKKNDFKDLKRRLFNYKENKTKLDAKKLKLEKLYYNMSSTGMDIKGSASNGSKVEKYVLDKDTLEKNISELEFEVKELDIALNILTKKEYDLIELRYFEGYKPSSVYNVLHMSESTFWREHNRILSKIEKVIKL